MDRQSFVFYASFYDAIRDLSDNIKLEVFIAITEYALYGKQPENLKPVARGLFTLIKPNLDVSITKFEAGKKGGRKPKKAATATDTPAELHTLVVTPTVPPAYSSFDDEIALLKDEQAWWEPVCMQFHIDRPELENRLSAFAIHCKVERSNELHPSIKDAKRHFTSWMRKAYAPTERNTNNQPKPDDYTFRGGFGGLD